MGFLVEVPDVQGKITTKKKGNAVYVRETVAGRQEDDGSESELSDILS